MPVAPTPQSSPQSALGRERDARRRLLKARADQSKARYDYVRDVVALRIRTGELTDADVALWDRWFAPSSR